MEGEEAEQDSCRSQQTGETMVKQLQELLCLAGEMEDRVQLVHHNLQNGATRWPFEELLAQQLLPHSRDLNAQIRQTLALYDVLEKHNLSDKEGAGYFALLPDECVLYILSYLDERELSNVALLNRQFSRLSQDNLIWRLLCQRRWRMQPNLERDVTPIMTSCSACQESQKPPSYLLRCNDNNGGRQSSHEDTQRHEMIVVGQDIELVDMKGKVKQPNVNESGNVLSPGAASDHQCNTEETVKQQKDVAPSSSTILQQTAPQKRRRKDWKGIYLNKLRLDKNWRESKYQVYTLRGHDSQLYCLQFDEEKIVSGSEDETIKVWNLHTRECRLTMRGHNSGVWCLQFHKDRLLSGSEDATVKVWDLQNGRCIHTFTGHVKGVWSLQFQDRMLASGSEDHTIKIWDLQKQFCVHTLLGHCSDIWCLSIEDDQRLLVSGSGYEDRTIKLWDLRTTECVLTLTGHKGAVNSLAVFPESNSSVRRHTGMPYTLFSGSADQTIKVWDLRQGSTSRAEVANIDGHEGEVLCLRVNSTTWPRKIVSGGGSTDKTIRVWEEVGDEDGVRNGSKWTCNVLRQHTSGVWALQYDDSKIISGSVDRTINIWSFDEMSYPLPGPSGDRCCHHVSEKQQMKADRDNAEEEERSDKSETTTATVGTKRKRNKKS
ncbi:non-specific serine/threonine protein kinase [Balamuthia mandrillaris]